MVWELHILHLTSADDFAKLLELSNISIFKGKKVVLFIDEFDLIYQAPQDVLDSILNLFVE